MSNPTPARADHARTVQRIRRRYAQALSALPPGPPNRATLAQAFAQLATDWPALSDRLRVLRQLVFERLVVLDCEAQAPLDVVTHGISDLAEFALQAALQHAWQEWTAVHGQPRTPTGEVARLWVMGMGKLGARELNVSSDIDLVYVHDEDGQTDGERPIDNAAFFAKLARSLQQLIGETTEHGFVFRVDLALRPNGQSGPITVSSDALETYFLVQGREWERFAWLKGRCVASTDGDDASSLSALITPFVYRKHLDYNVFESLRQLHRQIRQQATRTSLGSQHRSHRAHDVKLGRGGIREIEFIVQLLQVVRAGRFPELRDQQTCSALARLGKAQLIAPETVTRLSQAYVLLRQVEHRIQYLDDQQTHALPQDDGDLLWIAQTLGHDAVTALLRQLDEHREWVANEFDALLGQSEAQPSACSPCTTQRPVDDEGLLSQSPEALHPHLQALFDHPHRRVLRDAANQRLIQGVHQVLQWLAQGECTPEAAIRWLDWLPTLFRRDSYLALLIERPGVNHHLLDLLGASRWVGRYLTRHPEVIDELAVAESRRGRFQLPQFTDTLLQRRAALSLTSDDDEEALLNVLRRAQRSEQFLTLARDVAGQLSVEQVADDLSQLADGLLDLCVQWVWERLPQRHQERPQLGIMAYGKLGGKELGYGSDLDLVFVYQDDHPQASDIYARLVRKLVSWLTLKTEEGDLYEIDTALRPNGNSGLLVSSLSAYTDYQTQRGSNTAWTWEHQAMTRARCCWGSPELMADLEAVRVSVITAPRDAGQLTEEICAMRARLAQARPVPADRFDLKHSPGGMIDVEFVVQHLVLLHSQQHPELRDNVGNIALLHRAQTQGLLPDGLGVAAADAYRQLRHRQHQARLNEEPTQVPLADWTSARDTILALWAAVLGPRSA